MNNSSPLVPERSTLVRVLEPEVMDTVDEARDYDAMDHGEVNRRFVLDFLQARRAAGLPEAIEILDLGTGTAQIPIELCRQDPAARVVGIDLAEEMLKLARRNVAQAGFDARIALERVDAKRLPFDTGRFEAVMSNSIVHHIPEPRAALTEALRVLRRPGGLVFVRDLARPFDVASLQRLVETYAAGCNAHQRSLFEASLRAALSVEEVRELVREWSFDPQSVQATSDRHWTWSAMAG